MPVSGRRIVITTCYHYKLWHTMQVPYFICKLKKHIYLLQGIKNEVTKIKNHMKMIIFYPICL